MNKIVISHGDKGGAGKSVVAAVTVDYFLLSFFPPLLDPEDIIRANKLRRLK